MDGLTGKYNKRGIIVNTLLANRPKKVPVYETGISNFKLYGGLYEVYGGNDFLVKDFVLWLSHKMANEGYTVNYYNYEYTDWELSCKLLAQRSLEVGYPVEFIHWYTDNINGAEKGVKYEYYNISDNLKNTSIKTLPNYTHYTWECKSVIVINSLKYYKLMYDISHIYNLIQNRSTNLLILVVNDTPDYILIADNKLFVENIKKDVSARCSSNKFPQLSIKLDLEYYEEFCGFKVKGGGYMDD